MTCISNKCPERSGGECTVINPNSIIELTTAQRASKATIEKVRIRAKMAFESEPSTEFLYGKILTILDQVNNEI